jgi:hypothetical protein
MPAQVRINPDVTAGEVYQDRLFCKEGEVALTKLALSKIAAVAGMSIDTYRTDPRTIPNLWEVKATARFMGIDGTLQALAATEELDLRDGTARAERVMGSNRSTAALQAVRAKGLRNCETRAINAAVRAFGIKQKYTIAELQKPFVVLRVVFQPDLSDPEVRRMVAARALQGSAVSAPTLPAADQAITDDEPAAETAGPNEPTEVVAEVPSDTLHGVTYTITRFARSGHLACTCRAFTFSRSQPPTCKHIDRYRRDAE